MDTKRVVMFCHGPLIGEQIERAWNDRDRPLEAQCQTEVSLIREAKLDSLEQSPPTMVLLTTDVYSAEFEDTVLEKCRSLNIPVVSVFGRSATVFVGPLELPGQLGCSSCLNIRWQNSIRHVGMTRAFASRLRSRARPQMPLNISSSALNALAKLVVDELGNILVDNPCRLSGCVGIFHSDGHVDWVSLLPSHACSRCTPLLNDSEDQGRLSFETHFVQDMGGLRVKSLDIERLERLYVHTDIGYISSIHELWTEDHQYCRASAQIQLPTGTSHVGYGSGFSRVEAKQKAMMEVLERICAVQATDRKPVVWETYANLSDKAIHPLQFGIHDAQIYDYPANHLQPFDEHEKYSWMWGYSTKNDMPILIPEQIAHYGHTRDNHRFVKESSNGCALGGTVEEAVLHGLCEVLERDGFLNMWYGRMPVPEIRLGSECPEETRRVYDMLEQGGYEVRLFDISHDMSIPAVLAVAIGMGNKMPRAVCGSSCHLNPYEAADGALRELMVQVLHLQGISEQRRLEGVSMLEDPTKIHNILDHVVVAGLPEAFSRWRFLLDNPSRGPVHSIDKAFCDVATRFQFHSRDIKVILNAALAELHGRGFDVIVVKQSNAEVLSGELHAVKVLVPGMTTITFGHGYRRVQGLSRVFELPYQMGYTERVLMPEDLNVDCHPFA